MKNLFITFILITATVLTANAQLFIEGYIDANQSSSSGQYINYINSSPSSFNVSPQVGYWLSDNIAVGISPSYHSRNNYTEWSVSVFGRYKVWEAKKLSLLIETPVGYSKSIWKETVPLSVISSSTNPTTIKKTSYDIYVRAYPLISYDLNKRFSLITRCNFLSIGFNSITAKADNGYKGTTNQFSFNANSNLFSSLGNMSIGFVYKF